MQAKSCPSDPNAARAVRINTALFAVLLRISMFFQYNYGNYCN